MLKQHWIHALVMTLALSFVTGCAALKAVEENPLAARLIVEQATMRYIQAKSDWPATAERVVAAAQAVEQAATGEPLTLAQLRQIALDAAGLDDLTPADAALARGLIDTVAMVVEERIGKGSLEGVNDLTTFQTIAGWAIGAAQTYLGESA